MAKKKKTDDSEMGIGEFDDWFADGESDDFWDDDKPETVEAGPAEVAAAEAAAAEATAAEAAAEAEAEAEAEAAAAEAAAAADAAAERLLADQARAAAVTPNPTIIADMDQGFPGDPETEIARPVEDDETEMASPDAADDDEDDAYDEDDDAYDDDDDAAATAEDFLGEVPDPTMILRREHKAPDPSEAGRPVVPAANLYDSDEIAAARAERTRRPEPEAPPPPHVPEVAPTVSPVRIAPTRPATESADRWADAAQALEREADTRAATASSSDASSSDASSSDASSSDASSSDASASLWAAAGRIHFERLGNWERAETLFEKAWQANLREPEFIRAFGDVVSSRGDFKRLVDLLAARADATTGVLAAESLQDAALVQRNSLRQPEAAALLLDKALELDPSDWFALRLLREIHYRANNWAELLPVLDRMASLVSGPRAARVHVERGRILEERLGDPEAARAAYEAALTAAPEYTPAFLAVERLAKLSGDHARLAQIYSVEADRSTGPDANYWRGRSLRLQRLAGADADTIAAGFAQLIDGGAATPELRREQQAFLSEANRWAEVAASLQAEADASEGMDQAWALFRLGQVQEQHLSLSEEAITSYRAAAEADPSAGPAVEAAAHLYALSGRYRDLADLLEETLKRLDDPNLVVTTQYRIGELCEGPLNDQEGAKLAFERILDTAPGYLPALEGLERVYTRLKAWDKLAAVYEQRAILAEEAPAIALQLHRAGSVCEFRLSDDVRAQDFYGRALENMPDFPPSLDAIVRMMETADDWAGLARVLRAASEATKDANEVVSLTYRSARILSERVGDRDQAMELLRRCLELSPGFLPAIQLLRDLAVQGEAWQDVYDLHRLEADAAEDLDRRHWRMLMAADAAALAPGIDASAVVSEILEEDASHVGALRLLEAQALATGDVHDQLAVYQRMAFGAEDDAARNRLAVRIAELAGDAGDAVTAMNAVSEVIAADGLDRPLGALARLAEQANYWEEAQRALVASGDSGGPDLARIQEAWLDDASAAARTWSSLLERDAADVEAAAGLERALARSSTREGLAHAHGVLADHLPDAAVAAVHALLAGHLFEADQDLDSAMIYYDHAFSARPVPGKAFDALRRVLVQSRNADGLVALYGRLDTASPLELAAMLEEAGAPTEAAALYRGVLADDKLSPARRLAVLVRLEQDLVELEAWKELFETLSARHGLTVDETERAAIESRRRWVLAEHLSETDEAWTFYRQLHEEDPQDIDVLEALARIAAARGETGLAIVYLEGLAQGATDPVAAARYQRRIAETHLGADAPDQARAALMRALDHDASDLESLRLLKDLATQAEDWPAVVGALARESTVLEGEDQVRCYRSIASTWQDKIENPDVAADAWRKVLEVAPADPEALGRLVALSRTSQTWTQLVEYGGTLVRSLEGAERAALLTEIGKIQLEQFHDEDEALRLLDAASREQDGGLEAGQLLERLHASRGQWDNVAEAVVRQARCVEADERVQLLVRAAEIRLETLHDRAGAAEVYAQVLEADPTHIGALRFRGDHLFEEGELEGAAQAYHALEGWTDDLDLDDFDDRMEAALYEFRYAESLRRLGRQEDSLERYRLALGFNQAHMPSLEAVGPILIERESWDEAGKIYRQLLQLIGGQGDSDRLCRTYTNLGTIERHQGKLDKAKKRFTKALDLKANDIGALQGMASVLYERKDWNNLLNVYNNIIYHAQEPEDVVNAYVTKGFVLDSKMDLPDKAGQHYEKSLAFNPAQPDSLLRLAELALRHEDWPEAGSLADRGLALQVERKDTEAGLLLAKAVAHAACGDAAAGKAACQGAIEVDLTLPGELGEDPSVDKMAQVLKTRLQTKP